MCLVLEVVLGVALAVILNRSRFEKILVTIFLMPMMMAPVIAGLVWYYLYNGTFGWYHWLLQSVGILGGNVDPRQPEHGDVRHRHRRRLAMDAADHADHAGRAEARAAGSARSEHGRRRRRRCATSSSITLPNLYPFLLIAILLRFMDNFRFIDAILVLTGGGPGGRHQDPADLSVRRLVPVLQARPRRGDRAHAAGRDDHSRHAPGEGLRGPAPASSGRRRAEYGHGLARHRPAIARRCGAPVGAADGAVPRLLPGVDGAADLRHVRVVLQGSAGGVQAAGGRRLGGRRRCSSTSPRPSRTTRTCSSISISRPISRTA